MEITVKKKTLFYFPKFKNEPLNIYDERGNIFYSSDFTKNFKGLFYLPKGRYNTDNLIVQSRGNLTQPEIRLPKRQWDMKHNFNNFEIRYGNNINKCTIFHDRKIILFDDSFKSAPLYQLAFMLAHEKGHNYYMSEKFADLFALRLMLKEGYNTSQVIRAIDLTLSDKRSIDRKIFIYKLLNKFYDGQ